jgi:hypothetical protein
VFSGKPNEDSNAHLQHFGRCVGLSLSVEWWMMQSVFAYSYSHCSGSRSNGFVRSEMPSTHGISALRHFSKNSSQWAKPMPSAQKFRASSSRMMRISRKHGNASRSTSPRARTMACMGGS